MKTEISVESKHQTLQGLTFPLQPAAQRALQQLRQKTINYIQLVSGRVPPPRALCHCPAQAWGRVCARPPVCALQLPVYSRIALAPTPSPSLSLLVPVCRVQGTHRVPLPCPVLAHVQGHL